MVSEKDYPVLEEILNDVLNTHGINLSPSPKRLTFPDGFTWRYFGNLKLSRGIKAYCWSITMNANGKYLSWIYRPIISKKEWEFVDVREHSKRKDAKSRALKLYEKSINKE